MIFPLRHACHLTEYILKSFIDNGFALMDPDRSGDCSIRGLRGAAEAA